MGFCTNCGNGISDVDKYCQNCSASVPGNPGQLHSENHMAQPLSRTDVIKPTLQQKDPDINGYSLAWQLRFEAVRRAGGEGVRWLRYPSKNLTLTDRRTILINIPAFIFGPFYYIYLGMWKKAITLTILCLIFGAVLSSIFLAENIQSAYLVTGVLNGLIFSSKVNIDYYRKIYFKEKSWW